MHYWKTPEEKEPHNMSENEGSNPGQESRPVPPFHLNPPAADLLLTLYLSDFSWAPARTQRYESKPDGEHTYLFSFIRGHDHKQQEVKMQSPALNLDFVHMLGKSHLGDWICDFMSERLLVHGCVPFQSQGRQWIRDVCFCLRSQRLLAADPSVQACSLQESCQVSH